MLGGRAQGRPCEMAAQLSSLRVCVILTVLGGGVASSPCLLFACKIKTIATVS